MTYTPEEIQILYDSLQDIGLYGKAHKMVLPLKGGLLFADSPADLISLINDLDIGIRDDDPDHETMLTECRSKIKKFCHDTPFEDLV